MFKLPELQLQCTAKTEWNRTDEGHPPNDLLNRLRLSTTFSVKQLNSELLFSQCVLHEPHCHLQPVSFLLGGSI